MAKGSLKVDITLDSRARNFFDNAPEKLAEARKNVVEACGMVWADEAKKITRNENHVDTSLYVNSIGYVTGSPASQSDVINELNESGAETTLKTGSAVEYAASLEKRYGIMARGLDVSEGRMNTVAKAQVKKALNL
ncbi:hypothetical protein [Halobacillus sp. H74]|uniref:hypothetical protein n=1 Tax=Halobacillus sp. H74 TaxID=3457436 RepID=UPI003FCDF54C